MAKMKWKSKEEIQVEKEQAEREALMERIKQARMENVLNDTEMLAEMILYTAEDNIMMMERIAQLETELEALKNEPVK